MGKSKPDERDAAFEAVLEENWNVLVGVARRYGSFGSDPNDVIQEAVCRTYDAWVRGRVHEDLGRYLTVTCRNVAIGLRRRATSTQRFLDEWFPDVVADGQPEEEVVERIANAGVADPLSGCSDRCRELLTLKFLDGLSEREIAARLMIAPGTVKSGCHRCLKEARRSLEARR